MKLHLPVNLRKALLALYAIAIGITPNPSAAEVITIGSGDEKTISDGIFGSTILLNGGTLVTKKLQGNFDIKGELELKSGTWTHDSSPIMLGYERSTGVIRATGGEFIVNSSICLGNNTYGQGIIEVDGGNLTTQSLSLAMNHAYGYIYVKSGNLTTLGGVQIGEAGGRWGDGKIEISGGTWNSTGNVSIIEDSTPNSGASNRIFLYGGTWDAQGGISIPESGNGIFLDGGTFKIESFDLKDNGVLTWKSGTLETNATIKTGDILTLTGQKTLKGSLTNNGTLVLIGDVDTDQYSYSGSGKVLEGEEILGNTRLEIQSGSYDSKYYYGGGGVLKTTSGTATLGAVNGYSGGTEIAAGVLQVGTIGALGTGDIIFSGGILQLLGDGTTINQVQGSRIKTTGASMINIGISGTLEITGGINSTGSIILRNSALAAGTQISSNSDISLSGNSFGNGSTVSASNGTITVGDVTLVNSYINAAGILIDDWKALTLQGTYTSPINAKSTLDASYNLGSITTKYAGGLLLKQGADAEFMSYLAHDITCSLSISDSSLTQTKTSGGIVTVKGKTTIINTADGLQAKLAVMDSLALIWNITITGVEGGEKAVVSSVNDLTIGGSVSGSVSHTNAIRDAALSAGTGSDNKTFTLAGVTDDALERNTITAQNLVFDSAGRNSINVGTLVSGVQSYSNVVTGTDNYLTGTNLTVDKSVVFTGGSLKLSDAAGDTVNTTIAAGQLLGLDNAGSNPAGGVINLGDITLLASAGGNTMMYLANGTQAKASSLTMAANSLLAIDGTDRFVKTTLTLADIAKVNWDNSAGISVKNNGHLLFAQGDLTITEANKGKLQWDSSSEVKTLNGGIVFDGVKDALESAAPIRGEIAVVGNHNVELVNQAQIFATGVTSHNLILHDAETKLQIHISDQSAAAWPKMNIADTITLDNGTLLTIKNNSARALDLGRLGFVKASGSKIDLAGFGASADFLKTSTITLTDSQMSVTGLELRADTGTCSINLQGSSVLTLDGAALTDYDSLNLAGNSSASLNRVTLDGGNVNMSSTGTVNFSGTNDLGSSIVTMNSGSAVITGTTGTYAGFRMSGGSTLALGSATDAGSLAGNVSFQGGYLHIVNLGESSGLSLSSGYNGGGTVEIAAGQTLVLGTGKLTGSGQMSFLGQGGLTLTGSNAGFSAGIFYGAGALTLEADNAFGSGAITLASASTGITVRGTQGNTLSFIGKTVNLVADGAATWAGNITGGKLAAGTQNGGSLALSGPVKLASLATDGALVSLTNIGADAISSNDIDALAATNGGSISNAAATGKGYYGIYGSLAADGGTITLQGSTTSVNGAITASGNGEINLTDVSIHLGGNDITVNDTGSLNVTGGTLQTSGTLSGGGSVNLDHVAACIGNMGTFTGELDLVNRASLTSEEDMDISGASLDAGSGSSLAAGGSMSLAGVTLAGVDLTAGRMLTLGGTKDNAIANSSVKAGFLTIGRASALTDSLLTVADSTMLNSALTITGGTGHVLGAVSGAGALMLASTSAQASAWTNTGALTLNAAALAIANGNSSVSTLAMSNASSLTTGDGLTVSNQVASLTGSKVNVTGDLVFAQGIRNASGTMLNATGNISAIEQVNSSGSLDLSGATVEAGGNIEFQHKSLSSSVAILLNGASLTSGKGNISITGSLQGTYSSPGTASGISLKASQGIVLLNLSGGETWTDSSILAKELQINNSNNKLTFAGNSSIHVDALSFGGGTGTLVSLTLSGAGIYRLGNISNLSSGERTLALNSGANAAGSSLTGLTLNMDGSSSLILSGVASLQGGTKNNLENSTLEAASISTAGITLNNATLKAATGDIDITGNVYLKNNGTSQLSASLGSIRMANVVAMTATGEVILSAGKDIALATATFDVLKASSGGTMTLDNVKVGNHLRPGEAGKSADLSGKTLSVAGINGTDLYGATTKLNFSDSTTLDGTLTVSSLISGSRLGVFTVNAGGSFTLTGKDRASLAMSGLSMAGGANSLTGLNVDLGAGALNLTTGSLTLNNTVMQNGSALTTAAGTTLTFSRASSLYVTGSGSIVGTFAMTGGSILQTGGSLLIGQVVVGMTGSIISGGDMTLKGGVTTMAGSILNAGTHTLALGSSTLTNAVITAGTFRVNGATTIDGGQLLAGASDLQAALTIANGTGHNLGTAINNAGGLSINDAVSASGGTLAGPGGLTLNGSLVLSGSATVDGATSIGDGILTVGGSILLNGTSDINTGSRVESTTGSISLTGADSMIDASTLIAATDITIDDALAVTGDLIAGTGSIFIDGDDKDFAGSTTMKAGNGIRIQGANKTLTQDLNLDAGQGNLEIANGLADAQAANGKSIILKGNNVDLGATALAYADTTMQVGNDLLVSENLTIGKLTDSSILGNIVTGNASALSLTGMDGTVYGAGLTFGGASASLTGMTLDLGTTGIATLHTGSLTLVNTVLSGLSMTTSAGTTLTLGTLGSTTSLITLTGDFVSNGTVVFNDGSSIKANKLTFNGSVTGDINVDSGSDIYLSNVNGKLTLKAANLIDIANGDALNAGSSLAARNLHIRGEDTLTATDSSFAISGTTTIDQGGALNLVWTIARSTDSFGAVTVKNGTFSAQGIAGARFTASGITAGGGSSVTLNTIQLHGGISSLADDNVDTVNLTSAIVNGNIAINTGDVMNMTTSTVNGTVWMDNSSLNIKGSGPSTIDTLTLSSNAKVKIDNGATLTVNTAGIGTGSDMQINGTVTGNVTLMGGTATLASTGTVGGNLGIQGGTLSYNGGNVNGELSFLANPYGNSVINLGRDWTLASDKELAVNGNGTINMGVFDMTSHGLTGTANLTLTGTRATGFDNAIFTIDAAGAYTGDIILQGNLFLRGMVENAFGTGGTIVTDNGTHTVQLHANQSKGLTMNNGSVVNLQTLPDGPSPAPMVWSGLIWNNGGTLNTTGGGMIVFTGNHSNLGTLVLDASGVNYGSVAIGNGTDSVTIDAGSVTGTRSGTKDLIVSANATLNVQDVLLDKLTVNGILNAIGNVTTEGISNASLINGVLNAAGDISLRNVRLGDGSTLHGSSVTLGGGDVTSATGLSIKADHDLILLNGAHSWKDSLIDVQDRMENRATLTLIGGNNASYKLGGLTNYATLNFGSNLDGVTVQAASLANDGTLDIKSNSSLIVTGDITSNGKTRIYGSLTGASITFNGTQDSDNLFVGGTLTATTGHVKIAHARISTGAMTAAGDIDISGHIYGIWSDSGLSLTSQNGNIYWNVENQAGTGASTANTSMDAAKDIFLNIYTKDSNTSLKAGGTLFVNADTDLKIASLSVRATRIAAGVSLTLGTNVSNSPCSLGTVTNLGTFQLSGGFRDLTASAESLVNSGTLNIGSFQTLNVINDITSTAADSNTTVNGTLTGGNMTLAGTGNILTNGKITATGNLSITNGTMGTTTLDGDMITLAGTFGTSQNNTVNANKLTVDTNIVWNTSKVTTGALAIARNAELTLDGHKSYPASPYIHTLGTVDNAGTLTIGVDKATSATASTVTNSGTLSIGQDSSLTVSGAVVSTGSTTVAGDLHGSSITLGGTGNVLTNGTLASASTMTVTNATLGSTTLTSVTDMTISGTLTDGGNNSLTSSDGNITLNSPMNGANNTITAVNGTVDINAAISGNGLNVIAQDLIIDASLTTTGDNVGCGMITVAGTMDVNAAAALANVALNVARTDIIGSGSSLSVTNSGAFGKLGNVTVDDHGALTLLGMTAGTQSTLTADIQVSNNSTASFTNTALSGNILISADANALTLDRTSVIGNITLLGASNTLSMTTSSITGALTMDGGQFDLYGANAVGELLLNTTNINLTLHNGATLTATGKETVINKNGLYIIEGTHRGDIRISNGTVNLGSSANAGTLAGHLGLENGTLNYNNGTSAITTGKNITLAGKSTDSRDINVNADWDASGNKLIAHAGGTLNLTDGNLTLGAIESGNGKLIVNGGEHELTLNGTGTHTGGIVLNGATASNGGNMTTTEDGEILVHGGNLKMNEAINNGDMIFDQSAILALNVLTSSDRLTIGSTVAGDRSRVDVSTNAALSGDTTINSGSTLDVVKNVDLSGTATVDGTISGKDITIQGNGTSVNGTNGTINADKGLNIGAGAELGMAGNSTVTAGTDITVGGSVSVEGSLAAGNNMNVSGSLTTDGTTKVGGSLGVTGDGGVDLTGTVNVSDKTTIAGNGSVSLDAAGSGDLGNVTVSDNGNLDIAGNGNSINADNITMDGNATGSISDTVLNLSGSKGGIILNDGSSLDIANSTINGSITTTNTATENSTHLGLDQVDINGNLTVVGGDLVLSHDNTVSGSLNISDTVNVTVNDEDGMPGTLIVKEGTTIDPNVSLTIDNGSNFTSNVTMTGGSFTVNGNANGNNFNGSIAFKPNNDIGCPEALAPVITINGTHNQNAAITVDADASINVNNGGILNVNCSLSSGSNGDDTLTLNGNGESGKIVINSSNEGFADDISIGGGTLVINGNEAIGKEGSLSITGEDVTLQNTLDGATVSKNIATNGNGLTIRTDEDFTLAGQVAAAGDTITKTGDAELVLSHDPVLNDAKSIIGSLDQIAGDITIDGTDYTIGEFNIAAGDQRFTSLGGNTIHHVTAGEGSSIILNAVNPAVNGSKADILGNSETNDGTVNLDGATLETEGTIFGLDELNLATSSNGTGSSATLANSEGTITHTMVSGESELTLDGSSVTGTDLINSGTTTVKDSSLTLDDALYILDSGELNIDGASTIDSDIVLADGTVNILADSSSVITAESTLYFNAGHTPETGNRLINVHENFTMEGTIAMNSDGTIMVDSNKNMNVNGGFIGTEDLYKTGQGSISFNKAGADYSGTVHLTEGSLAATASNAYGSVSTLNIHGTGVNVLTGIKGGDPIVFDSAVNVDGDHAFTVNTLSHTTWNGLLAGAKGTMTKIGSSTLAITNASSQGFSTAIKVNEGALALNGNIGSDITLAKGTMLSGDGSTAGHVNARENDTIIEIGETGKAWTGSNGSVETLTLGSTAFERSEADCMGVYKTGTKTIVDLDLAHTASDRLVVTGKADFNNSLLEIRKGAYTPTQERGVADGTRFHIVEAGELAGTFHNEVQHDLYLLNAHLENTSTGTDLVLSINHKGADKNGNQGGISGVIEGIDNDGAATGELLDMVNAFKHTRSEAEAKAALDSVGGTRLGTMMSSMLAGNINHLRNLRGSMGTGSYAISVTPDAKGGMISHGRSDTEVWVSPTTGYNKVNGDGNAPGFSRSSWGAMMGVERSLDAKTMLGLSLGYDYARTEVMGATDEADTCNIDLYGAYRDGAWQNRASFGIGFHDFTNDRFVSVGDTFAHMSRGGTTGTSLNFTYELSYAFLLDSKSTIAPLFTVESSLGWIGSYSEKGDIGNAGLYVDRQDAWATLLGLGGRYTREFSLIGNAPAASFEAMALMTIDAGDQGAPVTASFLGAPGRHFTVKPAANSRIGAMLGAGVNIPFNNRLTGFGGTTFEFRNGTRDFTANVGIRYAF